MDERLVRDDLAGSTLQHHAKDEAPSAIPSFFTAYVTERNETAGPSPELLRSKLAKNLELDCKRAMSCVMDGCLADAAAILKSMADGVESFRQTGVPPTLAM